MIVRIRKKNYEILKNQNHAILLLLFVVCTMPIVYQQSPQNSPRVAIVKLSREKLKLIATYLVEPPKSSEFRQCS